MSTNIFNARISPLPLAEVHKRLLTFKPLISEIGKQIINTAIARQATEVFDDISLGLKDPSKIEALKDSSYFKDLVYHAYKEACDRFRDTRNEHSRDAEIDTHFEIALIPTENPEETLFMCFCEHQKMLDVIYDAKWNEDFHYQNSTDRPEGVSENEWKRREELWDQSMPTGRPADVGLICEIFDGKISHHADQESILRSIPDTQSRIKKLARVAYLQNATESDDSFDSIMKAVETFAENLDVQEQWKAIVAPAIVPLKKDTPIIRRHNITDAGSSK
ncbi:MAG: hypothetical protein CL472_07540 [Acidobacteria bacterium]|nr:hypothetical protein [Acidobacteriota bacterium]|tara:strand:- start:245 stop:1075 length:831 start_codon:yes stop_codon:yes gene_type:complete